MRGRLHLRTWLVLAVSAPTLASCRDEALVAPSTRPATPAPPPGRLATVFGMSTGSYDDVGNFGINAGSSPFIGDNGDLAGGMAIPGDVRVGVRWSPNDGLQQLGAPLTCTRSEPADLNMAGTIVGQGTTCGPSPSQETLAFRWDKGTGFTLLARPTSPCAYRSAASAINNAGVIAGSVVVSPCVYAVAAWYPDGSIITQTANHAAYSVTDINEAGQVTGTALMLGANSWAAFVWTPGGQFITLPMFASDSRGMFATDINENGTVVGYGYISRFSDDVHAFRWTPNGGLQDLGVPAGSAFTRSQAAGVSDTEEIFGTLSGGNVGTSRAFYWTPTAGMTEVPLPPGAAQMGATDFSSSGIGTGGINFGGVNHAYRWSKANGFEDLGTGIGTAAVGYSINNAGQVGGMVWVDTPDLIRWARWNVVTNRAPTAAAGGPYGGSEGNAVSFDGTGSTDPDGNTLTYAWDFGDGATGTGATPTHEYADNGSYTVSLTVSDGNGGTDTKTTTATVTNLAPTGTFVVPSAGVPQGTGFTISIASATDPSTADVTAGLQYAFDCEDDATFSTPSGSPSLTCTIGTSGEHTVAGRVIDKDGAFSTYSASVAITSPTNAAPVASVGGPYAGQEGTAVSFSATGSSDTDGDALTYAWEFGDGGTGTGLTTTHTYADDGTYTVSVTVSDGKGGSDTKSATVVIDNVAPQWGTTLQARSISSGQTVVAQNSFTDAGATDAPWNWSVDWGTGAPSTGTASTQGNDIAVSRTYCAAGSYTVTFSVTDKDGRTGTTSFGVSVARRSVAAAVAGTINLSAKSAKVNLNVFSDATFDATLLDVASATLGNGAGTDASAVSITRTDLNGDGRIDAQLVFARDEIVANGDLTPATTQLVLLATLTDGCVQVRSAPSVKVK